MMMASALAGMAQAAMAIKRLDLQDEYRRVAAACADFIEDDDIEEALDDFKFKAAKQYKRLARGCHPDLGGSLEDMQKLNEALLCIRKISPAMLRPAKQRKSRPDIKISIIIKK